MDPSCITEEPRNKGRLGRRRVDSDGDDTKQYKSKNLEAERKRRQKLSDRLLALRSLVPNITNMNKATIIEDAINYIEELQNNVKSLSDMLLQLEASSSSSSSSTSSPQGGETKPKISVEMEATEDLKKIGIQEEVQVCSIHENKIWMKIILEKRKGRFTKLVEGMTCLGLELTDTTITTLKGAILISSCVEGTYGDTLTVQQTKDMLLDIMRTM